MEAERQRESTTQEPIIDIPDTAREAEPSQPHKGKSKYMKHFTRLEDNPLHMPHHQPRRASQTVQPSSFESGGNFYGGLH